MALRYSVFNTMTLHTGHSLADRFAATLHQIVCEARDAAHDDLDLFLILQIVKMLMESVGNNLTELMYIVGCSAVDDGDGMRKVSVAPLCLYCFLELLHSKITEPVNLVLDRHSEDFGMLDDVYS